MSRAVGLSFASALLVLAALVPPAAPQEDPAARAQERWRSLEEETRRASFARAEEIGFFGPLAYAAGTADGRFLTFQVDDRVGALEDFTVRPRGHPHRFFDDVRPLTPHRLEVAVAGAALFADGGALLVESHNVPSGFTFWTARKDVTLRFDLATHASLDDRSEPSVTPATRPPPPTSGPPTSTTAPPSTGTTSATSTTTFPSSSSTTFTTSTPTSVPTTTTSTAPSTTTTTTTTTTSTSTTTTNASSPTTTPPTTTSPPSETTTTPPPTTSTSDPPEPTTEPPVEEAHARPLLSTPSLPLSPLAMRQSPVAGPSASAAPTTSSAPTAPAARGSSLRLVADGLHAHLVLRGSGVLEAHAGDVLARLAPGDQLLFQAHPAGGRANLVHDRQNVFAAGKLGAGAAVVAVEGATAWDAVELRLGIEVTSRSQDEVRIGLRRLMPTPNGLGVFLLLDPALFPQGTGNLSLRMDGHPVPLVERTSELWDATTLLGATRSEPGAFYVTLYLPFVRETHELVLARPTAEPRSEAGWQATGTLSAGALLVAGAVLAVAIFAFSRR